MRKSLMVVAIAALAVALAAPAMAVDWEFGGKTRVRMYDYDAIGFDGSQTTNPGNNIRGTDLMFRVKMTFSDDNQNILSVLQLRWGKIVFGNGGGVENPANWPSMENWTNAATADNGGWNGGRVAPSDGGALGGRDINLELEMAYLDFQVPFGVPLRIRAGLQPWYEPKGILIDDLVTGIRAYGKANIFNYEAEWYRLDSGNRYQDGEISGAFAVASRYRVDSTDNNWDVWGGKFGASPFPWLNPALYFYYSMNKTDCQAFDNSGSNGESGSFPGVNTEVTGPICPGQQRERTSWYLGLTDTGKFGDLTYDFDWIYGYANGGATGTFYNGSINGIAQTMNTGTIVPAPTPITTKGWALDLGAHYAIGPFTVNLVGSYATGDTGKSNGQTDSAFPGGFSPAWNGPGGFYDLIGNGAGNGQFDILTTTTSSPTGLWTIGLYGTYNPVKAVKLSLGWAYAGWVSKWANCAWAGYPFSAYPAAINGVPLPPSGVATTVPAGNGLTAPESSGASTSGAACYGPWIQGKGYSVTKTGLGQGGLVGATSLGNEINLKADWQVYTGFKIQGVTAWLIPTVSGQNTEAKYAIQAVYDF